MRAHTRTHIHVHAHTFQKRHSKPSAGHELIDERCVESEGLSKGNFILVSRGSSRWNKIDSRPTQLHGMKVTRPRSRQSPLCRPYLEVCGYTRTRGFTRTRPVPAGRVRVG